MEINFKELKKILETVFNSVSEIKEDSTYLDVEEWDSMVHVSLILTLQENYKIEISNDDALEMNTIPNILHYLNMNIVKAN